MIYILAEGGESIGMGHVLRSLVLAKRLKENFNVKYFSSYENEFAAGINKVKSEFFDVIDIEEMERYLNMNSVLLVDSYNIRQEQLMNLRKKVKLLCYIDDNNHLDYYDVDLLINQNAHGGLLNYNAINSKILVGGKYTLLREEFTRKNSIKINREIEEILVTIGGSDNSNLTNKILREIKYFKGKINVVIGNAFIYKDYLINKYKEYSNIIFHVNPNMSELMIKNDLAISACGSTLYELSYLGIPTLGLIIVDNQELLGNYMSDKEIIKLSSLEKLYNDISLMGYEHRVILSGNMKKLLDGQGTFRITKEIEKLLN